MFINNSESGLDKLFQFCRITLQHSGFVNLLPRIYGHVIQGGTGKGRAEAASVSPIRTLGRPRQVLRVMVANGGCSKRLTFFILGRCSAKQGSNTSSTLLNGYPIIL